MYTTCVISYYIAVSICTLHTFSHFPASVASFKYFNSSAEKVHSSAVKRSVEADVFSYWLEVCHRRNGHRCRVLHQGLGRSSKRLQGTRGKKKICHIGTWRASLPGFTVRLSSWRFRWYAWSEKCTISADWLICASRDIVDDIDDRLILR